MATTTKSLQAKLVLVMQEVAYVQRTGQNDFHHYSYASASDVLTRVNAALTKHNIASVVIPTLISMTDVVNAKGNKEHLACVSVEVQLYNADNPGEMLVLGGLGTGVDSGDKAVMKAETAAIKYAYLLSLAISSGDDPEKDLSTDENYNFEEILNAPKPESKPASNRLKGAKSSATNTDLPSNEWGLCESCGNRVSPKVLQYSTQYFNGKKLCYNCQSQAKKGA